MEHTNDTQQPYKTFKDTYKIVSFMMSVGMIYPDPRTATRRIICVFIILISALPLSIMMLLDMYHSLLRRDIFNIIRHSTIVGPFIGGITKMFLMHYKMATAKNIMDEIDKDYAKYNNLPQSYKDIINIRISDNILYSEKCWVLTVVTCVLIFPGMAVFMNIYNTLFMDEPSRVMIHELVVPFMPPERKSDTPIFEIMFIYMLYICVVYIINFIGVDSFFGLSVNHACLKMELYCKAIEDALKVGTEAEMKAKIVDVILEQNRVSRFADLIQETFNIWLGLILIATMIQIGTCMFHLTEVYTIYTYVILFKGGSMDLRYIIFMIGTVIHIYLPCRYSAKLQNMSLQTATLIYSAGWEVVRERDVRKTVQFMIARAQVPTEITAFNLLIFDMNLFVTIMNSSYSMYTLLRS